MTIIEKLTSRKLWLSIAAMLAGIGATIAGISGGSTELAIIGTACTAISAGIYAFAEAWTDAANGTVTTEYVHTFTDEEKGE